MEEHRHPSLSTRCVCNVWNIILLIVYVGIIIPLHPCSKVCIAFPHHNQQLIVWWIWHSYGRSIGVQRSLHHFLDRAKSTTWTWFRRWTMFFFLSFFISDVCTFTWIHSKKICVCVSIFPFTMKRFFEGMHRIRKNWRFFFSTILEIGQVRCSESEERGLVGFDEEANVLLEAVAVHNHMIGF